MVSTIVLAALLGTAPELDDIDREIAGLEAQQISTDWMKAGAGLSTAGGLALVTGGVLVGLDWAGSCGFFSRCARNPYAGLAEAGVVTMSAGAALILGGGIMALSVGLLRGGEPARHLARLRERRLMLENGERPTRAALAAIADRHRPSLGPAVALFTLGGAATTVGVVMLAIFAAARADAAWYPTAGGIPLAFGLGVTALGFRELGARDRENAAIDAELPPPVIQTRLPPAPVLLGYAGAF